MSVRKRTWSTPKGEERSAWVVDYIDQQGRRRLKSFRLKKQADEFAKRAGVEVLDGVHVPEAESETVAQAAEHWIKAVAVGRDGRSPAEASTLRQYRGHIDHHIVPAIGTVKLSKLSGPRVAEFRDHLLAGLSRPLAKKVLTSFKSIVKEAQTRGAVVANPAAAITIRGAGGRHQEEVEIPEVGEVRALFDKLDELAGQRNKQHAKAWRRYRALIATAVHTGMRASELRGLPWSAVDLKAGTVAIVQRADENGVIGSPKSAKSRRMINIPAPLLKLLREWKAECPPGALAFPNWQGRVEALANIHTRCWKPLQLAAGLSRPKLDALGNPARNEDGEPIIEPRYTFHAIRHFRASLLIADGANPKEVQAELGHSTITLVFSLYGHLFKDDAADRQRKERAERLASSFDR